LALLAHVALEADVVVALREARMVRGLPPVSYRASLIVPPIVSGATPMLEAQCRVELRNWLESPVMDRTTPAPDIHTTAGKLADLDRRMEEAVHAGPASAVEKQHAKGKKTARERVTMLLDPDSFTELDEFARHRSTSFGMEKRRPYGDGVVTGFGTIDGRPVCVFSQDVTVFGGSLGQVYGEKIVKIIDFALKTGCPIIGLNEGGGARIQEGVVSLGLYGEIFRRNTHASGVIPQISLIMGAAAGGHVYSPALTDFVIMVDQTSQMFITGPDVIKTVTGEDVSMEDLGGGRTHNTRSGNAHYLAANEEDAISFVRTLIGFLPQNNLEDPPIFDVENELVPNDGDRDLDSLIPDSPNQPYDMHEVISRVLDDADFLEVHALFAPNVVVGFGRIDGRSVGVVANQPLHFAGCLDIDASEKAARFVRTCDAFNIPVITFVDVPGFLPGTDQEWNGIIRRGAKLIYAYAEATVPLVTVITRKAYGGAYDVMGSKHLGADLNLAWPTAQIAVMGAQGAVNILYRKELAASDDPETLRTRLVTEYEDELANPYHAAERGYVDAVINPHETRGEITRVLRLLRTKRQTLPPKKHGNIPL
jgi:propionyl-CoA carboxylase beta chain